MLGVLASCFSSNIFLQKPKCLVQETRFFWLFPQANVSDGVLDILANSMVFFQTQIQHQPKPGCLSMYNFQ